MMPPLYPVSRSNRQFDLLCKLTFAQCDGVITQDEVAQLDRLLSQDDASVKLYAELTMLVAELKDGPSSIFDRYTDDTADDTATTLPSRALRWLVDTAHDYAVLSCVVSTLFLAVLLLSLANIIPDWRRDAPAVAPINIEFVATITNTEGVTFSPESVGNFRDVDLFEGERLILESGLAELTFRDGAVVLLEGPANLQVDTANAATLEHGRLTARVADQADGFAITTSMARIVDLGTEFGVRCAEGDVPECQVYVYEGSVELQRLDQPSDRRQHRILRQGEGVALLGGATEVQVTSIDRPLPLKRVIASRAADPVEAALVHHWTFNDGTARDRVGGAHGQLEAGASIADGRLHLDGGPNGAMQTAPVDADIHAKTLVSWVRLNRLDQAGGSVLTLEAADGSTFDGIVYGERTPRQWMAGSDGYRRTPANNSGEDETLDAAATIMLAVVYRGDGHIHIYRNGESYAEYSSAAPPTYSGGSARAIFGRRHSGGDNWQMDAAIDEARIYATALSAAQIRQLYDAGPLPNVTTGNNQQ